MQQQAHAAVLTAMRQPATQTDSSAIEAACVALRCLARASSNIISIAVAGGIQLLLSSMQHHSTVSTVQIEGFKALFNLAFDPSNQESIVVECQGLDVITTAFLVHVHNPHVQEFGCNLLHNLAFKNFKNKTRIATHGCVAFVIQAMANHATVIKVQIEACRALMSLAFASECQTIIAQCGGIEQIFNSMNVLQCNKNGKLLNLTF